MNCPNCNQPFAEERGGKFLCSVCGWFEKIGKEWKSCTVPESPTHPGESPTPPESAGSQNLTSNSAGSQTQEPDPAALEPDPVALEPDPAALEPDPAALELDPAAEEPSPEHVTKSYLGGLLTVTEVDE